MTSNNEITDWLPVSLKDAEKRGWDGFDVILISGDAYVDHPAFGHAVIGRIIEKAGLRVGIVPQPNWLDDLRDFKKLGIPRLFFGVTSGCMDSMVNHYTANKRLHSNDAYTPGGVSGFRPDYATTVYTRILKSLYPGIPVIIGGIEASMRRLTQQVNNKTVIVNPPYKTMTDKEIDASFDLPYTRLPHPRAGKRGKIPAYEMIRFSVNMHHGCFGGCSFCTISAHQGKMIAGRSEASIMKEVEAITKLPGFKGIISDLGGPSANMYGMNVTDQAICAPFAKPSCIYPSKCFNLNTSHKAITRIYRLVHSHPGVRKAFVSSGLRYDLFMGGSKEEADKNGYNEYIEELVGNHISGRLKVAPEHTSERALKIMRKPGFRLFHEFKAIFDKTSKRKGLNQHIIPYFISSHPGSTLKDMAELAAETKEIGFKLEQVQDFTPTPMTLSTVIYYSSYHPYTLKPVFAAKTRNERQAQNRFFFWYKKENRDWIKKTLKKLGRPDLAEKLLK